MDVAAQNSLLINGNDDDNDNNNDDDNINDATIMETLDNNLFLTQPDDLDCLFLTPCWMSVKQNSSMRSALLQVNLCSQGLLFNYQPKHPPLGFRLHRQHFTPEDVHRRSKYHILSRLTSMVRQRSKHLVLWRLVMVFLHHNSLLFLTHLLPHTRTSPKTFIIRHSLA